MAARLQATRATAANLAAATPIDAELVMTTDTKKMFLGDGTTLGGIAVNPDATEAVAGLAERATDAEVRTGTDTTRYISPNQYRLGMLYGGVKVAWVDATNGSDANGAVGRFDRPYLTINAALTAVGQDGTVLVRTGSYDTFTTTNTGQSVVAVGSCIISGSTITVSHAGFSLIGQATISGNISGITVGNGTSLDIRYCEVFGDGAAALTINGSGAVKAFNCRFFNESADDDVLINSGSASLSAAFCRFTGNGTVSINTAAPVTITLMGCYAAAAMDAAVANNGEALVVDADFDF